jgi:hypothetical protein
MLPTVSSVVEPVDIFTDDIVDLSARVSGWADWLGLFRAIDHTYILSGLWGGIGSGSRLGFLKHRVLHIVLKVG